MERGLGSFRASFRFEPASAPYLRIARDGGESLAPDVTPDGPPEPVAAPPVRAKRPRSVSKSGTGRGTGRGGKPATDKLKRLVKWGGKRGEFIRFIGGRTVTMDQVTAQFGMSVPNVNGYLINIWKDHGIGYEKEGGSLKLVLPPRLMWSQVWAAQQGGDHG